MKIVSECILVYELSCIISSKVTSPLCCLSFGSFGVAGCPHLGNCTKNNKH